MAGRISSSLNLRPLDSNSAKSLPHLLNKTSQNSCLRRRTEDETKPKDNNNTLVLSLTATVVIGTIQISDVASVEAVAMESPVKDVVRRWIDNRTCPLWFENSLETIVPENLPRPSAHRRLELAGILEGEAPPVGSVVTRVNRAACFSV